MNADHPHSSIDLRTAEELLRRAVQAREHAYAPYSRFPVGAALLAASGEIFGGCNVENAAYGLTCCAERIAMFTAVSRGVREFLAIAVVGPQDDVPCSPCGSCRQVLFELAPELQVVSPGMTGGEPGIVSIGELLPGAFGPERLREGEGLR